MLEPLLPDRTVARRGGQWLGEIFTEHFDSDLCAHT